MKNVLKKGLSLLLAITIIFSSAYAGISAVDLGGLFEVKAKAADDPVVIGQKYDVTGMNIGGGQITFVLDNEGTATFTSNGSSPLTMMFYIHGFNESPLYNDKRVKKAVISEGIKNLGVGIFYDCTNLQEVKIGKDVKSIDDDVFRNCIGLRMVTIPNSVTAISPSAFKGCSEELVIYCEEDSYAQEFAITNGINVKIVSLGDDGSINERVDFDGHEYEVINRSLSWTDAKIECEKLGGHLVTITSAAENKFISELISGSTGKYMYWIGLIEDASTETLSWVTDEPVDYTNWNEGEPNSTNEIYTHIISERFSSAAAGKWNDTLNEGLNIKNQGFICEWDAVDEAEGEYTVYSVGLEQKEVNELKTVDDAEVVFGESHLNITSTEHYDFDIENCTLKETTKIFAVVPVSTSCHITAVHCNGYDALVSADQVKFPISGNSSDDEAKIEIKVYTDLADYKEFQVLQDGAVLKTSETGYFSLTAKTIPANSTLDVRVVGSDGTKFNVLETNIQTYEGEKSFSIEKSGIKINIPKDIKVIGGLEISIDLEKLPVFVMRSDDSIKIGIGNSNSTEYDGKEDTAAWGDWKNIVNKMGEKAATDIVKFCRNQELYDLNKGKIFSAGMKTDGSIFAAAYAEFKRVNGEWEPMGAGGYLVAEMRIGNEWQTFVYSVPVVLKLEGAVGANIDLGWGYDLDAGKCYLDCDIELTLPEVKGSAGIGIVGLFDGSVYAKLKNTLKVSIKNKYDSCVLNGEIGLSGKFLCFTGEKALWKFLEWQYYYNSREHSSLFSADADNYMSSVAVYDTNSYSMDSREHLENQSEWYGVYNYSGFALDKNTKYTERLLQESVYEAANPKTVTTSDGTTMMVWSADTGTRSTGNHVAIVYSVYDNEAGTWSEPKIVCDDGTADSYPDVIAYENNIYIAWVNVNKTFDETATIEEMAAACEISVASYNKDEDSFRKIADLTNNSSFNYFPSICVVNDALCVGYAENAENNPFLQKGDNSLYIATINKDGTYTTENVTTSTKPVVGLDIGCLNNSLTLAYLLDTDSNITTNNDVELFICEADKKPQQVTRNNKAEQSVQFSKINGQDFVSYYYDNNIYYFNDIAAILADNSKTNSIKASGNSVLTPEYKFVDDGNGTVLISKAISLTDDAANIYAFVYSGNEWLDPVKVTGSGIDIKAFDVYKTADDSIGVIYSKCFIKGEELKEEEPGKYTGTYKETVDLYSTSFNRYTDVALNGVTVYEDVMDCDGNVLVDINVTNNGLVPIDSFDLAVRSEGENVYQTNIETSQLLPGESRNIEVVVALGGIDCLKTYNFVITTPEKNDVDSANNEQTVEIGYVDFELSLDKVVANDLTSCVAVIKNNSCVSSNFELVFRKNSYDGEIVGKVKLPAVGAYEEVRHCIRPEFISKNFDYGDAVCVEIVSAKTEKDKGNNSQFFIVEQPDIDLFEYNVLSNNCIQITKYNGEDTNVVIPESFDDYTVTAIAANAISSNVISIILPQTIESVDDAAFDSASSLEEIKVEAGNLKYKDINGVLYSLDETTYVRCPIAYKEDVSFGYGVSNINANAFKGYLGLTSITIPDSVTKIGGNAFSYCSNLTEVTLPNSAVSIGKSAFSHTNIHELTLPENVVSIGSHAFADCDNLYKINYNTIYCKTGGLVSWFMPIFKNSENITDVVIGENVEVIPNYLFIGGNNITSVYTSSLEQWCSIDFKGDSANPLNYAENFYINGELVSELVIPVGVESIGAFAFCNFSGPVSITIPKSVTSIGESAFDKCNDLKYIFYAGSEEDWSSVAIDANNAPLNDAYIHYNSTGHSYSTDWIIDIEPTCTEAGVKSHHCFVCGHKADVVVIAANGHSYVWEENYENLTKTGICSVCGDVTVVSMPLDEVGSFVLNSAGTGYIITDCPSVYTGEAVIPEVYKGLPVTAIGTDAFRDCEKITSVVIPSSVISIGGSAFRDCINLTEIVLPENITSVPGAMCFGCINLENVIIPEGVVNIGGYAFGNCTSLKTVVIPESVVNIGDSVFTNCEDVITICEKDSFAHIYVADNSVSYITKTAETEFDITSGFICTDVLGADLQSIIGFSEDIEFLTDGMYIATGGIVNILKNGEQHSIYTMVVNSDVNGDSVCDVLDCFEVERVSNGNSELSGAYAMAADSNTDNIVDIIDYQAIVNKASMY